MGNQFRGPTLRTKNSNGKQIIRKEKDREKEKKYSVSDFVSALNTLSGQTKQFTQLPSTVYPVIETAFNGCLKMASPFSNDQSW